MKSENCLHCADLQEEMKLIKAQNKIIQSKQQSKFWFLTHKVHILEEQLRYSNNRCGHIEESLEILHYMVAKQAAQSSSSNVGANNSSASKMGNPVSSNGQKDNSS